jgi:hypothetical protein
MLKFVREIGKPGLVCLCALLLPASAVGDAIIRTQAMLASTIAELFVEDDRVYVELEIGLSDLEAFHNLLPDEIYEKMGNPPLPLRERLPRFFREDLAIVGDDGEPLPGRILDIRPRPRVRRDELTGEPLAQSEEEKELVVFARLEYALSGEPSTLTFLGPQGGSRASIGFVTYHHGIPVNDFRYVGPVQTLELDWQDPWYTRFRSRNLRRTYFAPMSGFIYVEPYEVRKEIIVRPRDLQEWIDLGLADRETIPVEIQPDLKRKVAEFLRQHHLVQIDGETIEPELARINFLERTVRTSRIVDPPVELDVYSAILGIIFVYPTDGLPELVTMDWDLWSPRIQRIPASSVDQAGPLPTILEPDFRVLEWRNFLKNPVLPTLAVLAPPPSALARWMLTARWVMLAIAAIALAQWVKSRQRWVESRQRWVKSRQRWRGFVTAAALVATAGTFWVSRDSGLTDARAHEVVSGLLHNVYRAFDFRQEEQIYDVLVKSVQGELLEQIYLETRRGLELASQGGARVKVKEIALVELTAEPTDGGGFVATTTWNAAGSVGHWGHVHQRQNQYQAELRVQPVAGVWKLTGMEILQEKRL